MVISEKSSRKGRGRPPITFAEVLDAAGPTGMSRRQKQNRYYAAVAINKLAERFGPGAQECAWLVSDYRARWTILSELGRIAHADQAFWDAAEWVLANKPKTAGAVRVIRTLRTGKRPNKAASAYDLAGELDRTIVRYEQSHPNLTEQQIAAALRLLLEVVEE
jgi:hypothetical protein